MKLLTKNDVCNDLSIFRFVNTYCFENIAYLLKRKEDYVFDYDVKLSNGLNLQRDLVWSMKQKSELIISLIKGISLGQIQVLISSKGSLLRGNGVVYKVIDGKQRMHAIFDFVNGEFPINNKFYFIDCDKSIQDIISNYYFRAVVSYEYPDSKYTDEDLINWFHNVNFAGTPQDVDHLDKLKKSLT